MCLTLLAGAVQHCSGLGHGGVTPLLLRIGDQSHQGVVTLAATHTDNADAA